MKTYEQARQLAIEYIAHYQEDIRRVFPNDSLVIENTIEFNQGWIFFFNSKLFLETRDVSHRFMGLGPVIVGKENGEIYQAGASGNVELLIEEFKDYLQTKRKP